MEEMSCLLLCRAARLAPTHTQRHPPRGWVAQEDADIPTLSSVWSLGQRGRAGEGQAGDPTGPQESLGHQDSSLLPVPAPSTASDSQILYKKRSVLSLQEGRGVSSPAGSEGEFGVSRSITPPQSIIAQPCLPSSIGNTSGAQGCSLLAAFPTPR